MSRVFVDTSAFVALLVPSDEAHAEAKAAFAGLRRRLAKLVTTSYVLVETYALLGRRLGPVAVASFRTDFAPLLEVVWVGEELHDRGIDLLLQTDSRTLSLVDAVSFLTIRDLKLRDAFAFDRHFTSEGFALHGQGSVSSAIDAWGASFSAARCLRRADLAVALRCRDK